MIGSYYRSQI